MNLLTRTKTAWATFRNPAQTSQRMMVNYPTYSTGEGMVDPSGAWSIPNTEFGIASAYIAVSAVRTCLDTYAWAVGQIPTRIIHNTTPLRENDEIIATSEDVYPRHIWYEAEKWHRRKLNIGLLPAQIYNQMLYDTVFVYKQVNQFAGSPRLQVLSSEAVTVYDPMGEIEYFQYIYPGGNLQIKPDRMAYNHGYNPMDADRGSSIVSSILSELNIERNLKKFLQAFFANDAMPGMVGSPETTLPPKEWQELKELLKQHYKGVGNRRRSLMLPFKFNFEVMDEPDIQKHYSLHEPMRQEIFSAFGVPLVLAGDNSSTPYKDADNVLANFINLRVKPIATDLQTFNNDSCVPWLDHSGTVRLELDFDKFAIPTEADTLRASVGTSLYQGEISTLNEAREKAGLDPLEGGDVFKSGLTVDQLKPGESQQIDTGVNIYEVVAGFNANAYTLNELREKLGMQPIPGGDQFANGLTKEQMMQGATLAPLGEAPASITKPAPGLIPAHTPEVSEPSVKCWQLVDPDTLHHAQVLELEAWERFLKARQGRAFTRPFNPDYLRGKWADQIEAGLASGQPMREVFRAIADALSIRDIQATRLQFEDAFDTAIRSALSGDMTRLAWGNEMRRIIRRGINAAYRDGLKDGGVEEEPDETEQDAIATLFNEQREYINNLAAAIFKDETVTPEAANQKAAMWWGKSVQPAYYAGFESAARNQMVEFVGDDGAESCDTCKKLFGQRHRLKDWVRKQLVPQQDGDSYICGGFACRHLLAPVQAKARGNWI